ncbi:DUF4238 domain-containing protein [Mesorhizobium sophorae]|uniref:DUF4238 domain-containing protein n=1 Tax=Mesorhizobium sophorae TaxID=1300294 RepID=UPI00142DCA4C|nr:DUF4238 domain-containing protein [Mesorhizobium sophorae]
MNSERDHSTASRVAFRKSNRPATRAAAQKLLPDLSVAVIDPLAHVWDEVVHRIVGEMLTFGEHDQSLLHINIREEMVLELARLQLWLGERIVEKRIATGQALAFVDPERERQDCLGPAGAAMITATAKLAYEHIWKRSMEMRWKPKSQKAMEKDANPPRPKLSVKPVGKNHFIPRWFIRDHWAVGGKVLRWRRTNDGWKSAPRGFGEWGFRQKLYSDRLEAYFSLIEGDAKEPVQMLLDTRPLNGPQRESLVGFLVIQMLRNPYFIDAVRVDIAPTLAEHGFAGDLEMASKAYEAIYQNNEFYNLLAHPVMWSRWALVRTRSPLFVLPDVFGARADLGDGLRVIVPLTPTACFVTLRGSESEKRIVPRYLPADEGLARRISSVLIKSAANEFLSHPEFRIDESSQAVTFKELLEEIEAAIDQDDQGSM